MNIIRTISISDNEVDNPLNTVVMSIESKIALLEASESEVEQVSLKMGEVYSLYEARKQISQELCRISTLEMDIYGPVREEIDVQPMLMIDVEAPSNYMIVWVGTLVIKDITYRIALDEESGKIIELHGFFGNGAEYELLKVEIEKNWISYLKEEE